MNKDDLIIALLAGLMVTLIFTLGLFIGGLRAIDGLLKQCNHYEDKTIVCLIDGSND